MLGRLSRQGMACSSDVLGFALHKRSLHRVHCTSCCSPQHSLILGIASHAHALVPMICHLLRMCTTTSGQPCVSSWCR